MPVEARQLDRDLRRHVVLSTDPTARAVFAEDAAALVGTLLAAIGVALHQVTGSVVPDALASIARASAGQSRRTSGWRATSARRASAPIRMASVLGSTRSSGRRLMSMSCDCAAGPCFKS